MSSAAEHPKGRKGMNLSASEIEEQVVRELDEIDLVETLRVIMLSRECDRRESILFRQGRGYFQMPAAGHECVAALAPCLQPGDYVYPYYRDRALLLAMGTPLSEIALAYFAKRDSSSQGRQMTSHFSDRRNNVVSVASPVGLQCLPAAGTAWAMRLAGGEAVTLCLLGDAACRQGEFYEAWCFAVQEQLFDSRAEWSFYEAQVRSTTHTTFPGGVGWLLHNIFEHTAHHVDTLIPFYELRAAQKKIEELCGPDIVRVEFFSPRAFLAQMRTCQLYEYRKRHWERFQETEGRE